MRDERRADALFREANVTVRAAGTHLRSVRGQPTHFQAFTHAHLGEQLSQQENSLTAESRDLDGVIAEMMGTLPPFRERDFILRADLEHVGNSTLRWGVVLRNIQLAIA